MFARFQQSLKTKLFKKDVLHYLYYNTPLNRHEELIMKLSVLAVTIAAIMASSAFAADIKPRHGGFLGSVGTAVDKLDVIKFTCGALPAPPNPPAVYNQAVAAVIDKSTVAAGQKPVLNVRIAPWNGTTCNWATGGTTQQDAVGVNGQVAGALSPDGNAISSLQSVISIAPGGIYCAKVTKTAGLQNTATGAASASGAESYELDTHCQDSSQPTNHNGSTSAYLCNEGTPATCAHD